MAQMGRPGLSAEQKAQLWERWKSGQSLSEIGLGLGKHAGSIFSVLAHNGGVYRAPRSRSQVALTLAEREEISRGVASGATVRQIAVSIARAPSTVSREMNRNGGRHAYRASQADAQAWDHGLRPKSCVLATRGKLRRAVAARLRMDWSPQQISGWLKLTFPDDASMRVSHETIYRSLFIQTRGVLNKELISHLRHRKAIRRSKSASTEGQTRGQIVDAVSIRERPAEIEDRAIPGHWEGDLIAGSQNTHIATLVERKSRFTMLVKVRGKDTESVIAGLTREVRKLPETLRRSLTWDRGMELAGHKQFTVATDVKVYFCDPRSPWQRGTNENTNGLLRQYLPKGTELAKYSQADLNKIALRLNQRPRKTLAFQTPAFTLRQSVASTR